MDEYEEVVKLLTDKEVSWKEKQEIFKKLFDALHPILTSKLESADTPNTTITMMDVAQLFSINILQVLVSGLVLELVETHKRLAKVEKSVKSLKKSMK